MHAEIRQLIAVRDNEPVAVDIANHVRDCARCRQRVAALIQVRTGLRELAPVSPPHDAWSQIAARGELETGVRSSRLAPRRLAAIAASTVAFAAVLLAASVVLRDETGNNDKPETAIASAASTIELQQRSRELELLLDRYDSGSIMSMRTAGTISELQDSIALIDHRLNAARGDVQQRALWQQRVELMETLVTVHVAETYLDSI